MPAVRTTVGSENEATVTCLAVPLTHAATDPGAQPIIATLLSPAAGPRQNAREMHCMTKNATMEVDGHEIQTPHCIQSSRFSSVLQFCIIWQVIESSD